MTIQNQNLFDNNYNEYNQKEKPIDLLRFLSNQNNYFSNILKWISLSRGDGKLTFQDYFLYQLYDGNKHSPKDITNFISEKMHWPITYKCCDMSWEAITEDKWISYNLLKGAGIKTPNTLAIIDQSQRSFGLDKKITSPEGLKSFLKANDYYPLFVKPNRGIGSFGCFIIKGIDDEYVILDQSEPITFKMLFEKIIGKHTYLVQACLENHQVLKTFSKYVATVRTVNLMKQDSVATPFTLIKIPSETNIADNFWRKGNILANIDPKSGVIIRAVRGKGIHTEEFNLHPQTNDQIVGLQLPHWEELRQLNSECARLFASARYQSLDIALTDDGPVVMEINTGGSFELPQLASGKGLLTEEVRDFFSSCGWKFG